MKYVSADLIPVVRKDLSVLMNICAATAGKLSKERAQGVFSLAKLFDYYLTTGAGKNEETVAIIVTEDGKFLAFTFSIIGDSDQFLIFEGVFDCDLDLTPLHPFIENIRLEFFADEKEGSVAA